MKIDFEKDADGLVPTIAQDARTGKVLMLGYMSRESFTQTEASGRATFFSRTRQKIWTKGETSGNFLEVREIRVDCDADTVLIKTLPTGAVCHTGAETCFNERNEAADFLFELERIVLDRKANPQDDSHTARLFAKGLNKIAQKVGEEAVELVIEAKDDDAELFKAEAADLLYHLLVLFAEKQIALADILEALKQRRR